MATAKDEMRSQTDDFEEYRRKMHPEDESEGRSVIPTPHKGVRMAFGVFMILLYVGMGIALMVNAFNWDPNFTWVRWLIGVVLVLYGIFRAYGQFSGKSYYGR